MQHSSSPRSTVGWYVALAFLTCSSRSEARELQKEESGKRASKKSLIDIVVFNYTDRAIDSFSVNGQGGGNVFLSSRTGGGGGSVCCARLHSTHSGFPRIRVKWQVDGCTYLTKSRISGEVFENIYPYYKQADVDVTYRDKSEPHHLEIHFYPDGSVLAELTATLSSPRVLLDGDRPDKSNFPRCPNDKKPEQ